MAKIKLECYGPVGLSRKSESLWEDIWASWKVKPGRKNYKMISPCIVSKTDLENKLKYLREYVEPEGYVEKLKELGLEEIKYNPEDDIKEYEKILDILNKGEFYIEDYNDELTEIYSPKNYIDKNESERILHYLLTKYYNLKNIKFKWKRPKFIAIST